LEDIPGAQFDADITAFASFRDKVNLTLGDGECIKV
jgi:hypothetical protein